MKLARNLLALRRILAFGVLEMTILANFSSAGTLGAVGAWLCLLLLVMTYLFDVTFHSVGRRG